jgi:hypothetical protein
MIILKGEQLVMDVIEYSEKIKVEFMKNGGVDLLSRYVMSEILPPICDYKNAVKIIQSQYKNQITCELLIIGAFLTIQWLTSKNEMLGMLNLMYNFLSDKEKSIINYLNALSISFFDENYKNNKEYHEELIKSVSFDVPFVYNRVRMARLLETKDSNKYYKEAINNIEKISNEKEIKDMIINDFVDPKNLINEEILGIYLSYVNYNSLLDEFNRNV